MQPPRKDQYAAHAREQRDQRKAGWLTPSRLNRDNLFASERECQRHLYLPWSANGMGYIAEAGRAVIETLGG